MTAASLLTVLSIAAGVRAAEVGQGSQRIEVIVRGVPAGHTLVAEREGTATLVLEPDPTGGLAGAFLGAPRRSVHLRLREQVADGAGASWGSTVILPQRGLNQVEYAWSETEEGPRVDLVSVHPTQGGARRFSDATRTNLALGWGVVVLGYLAVLVLAHVPSQKRGGAP